MSRWRTKGNPDVSIANFSLWLWTSTFRQVLRRLGFPSLACKHFVLFRPRRRSAAVGFANNHHSLLVVMIRGVWQTNVPATKCYKSARLIHQKPSVSRKTREAAAALLLLLPDLLCAAL